MLKQVLAVAVVGLLGTGCASAHDSNWGYSAAPQMYHSSSYYAYPRYAPIRYAPIRYAPIRYAPRYCPPQRWGWNGYQGQYPRGYQNNWHGHNDRRDHDDHDRDDHDGGNDWNRHH